MSSTLGEKLRQAREARGYTLSQVAEQTRISSQYLECIENDNYEPLPGGIFNKGFVKSFAKFVGINEQEALADYSQLVSQSTPAGSEETRTYRPEVLTDDSSGSRAPTIILAVVILALMTAGILFLVRYLQGPSDPIAVGPQPANANTTISQSANTNSEPTGVGPDMNSIKVEFTVTEPVSLTAVSDGKTSSNVITPGAAAVFEPKESVKLSYSKSLASAVKLAINGKSIAVPSAPANPKRNIIEILINKDTLAQIWSSGSAAGDIPPVVPDANANGAAEPPATPAPVRAPAPRPTRAANTPAPRPAANAPVTTPPRPAATRSPEL
ncbi:MAG: helix-turn-helix domain-containing protein [Pyrinomonadaceae bacterium]